MFKRNIQQFQLELPQPRNIVAIICIFFCSFAWYSPFFLFDFTHPTSHWDIYFRWALQFSNALSSGDFYPRWMPSSNYGLGEPAFLYYPPLFYFSCSIVNIFVDDLWLSIKITIYFSSVVGGSFVYLILQQLNINYPLRMIGLIIIIGAPFYLFMTFMFNSLSWIFSWPAISATIYFFVSKNTRNIINVPLAMSVAVTILSHILIGFILLITFQAVFLGLILQRCDRSEIRGYILRWTATSSVGLLLSAFYILPALTTQHLITPEGWSTSGGAVDWRQSFIFPFITSLLHGTYWRFAQWIIPSVDIFSFFIAIILFLYRTDRTNGNNRQFIALTSISLACYLFASEASYILWQFAPAISRVQAPFRFLSISAITSALLVILISDRSIKRGMPVAGYLALITALLLPVSLSLAILAQRVADGTSWSPRQVSLRDYAGQPEYFPADAKLTDKLKNMNGCFPQTVTCEEFFSHDAVKTWHVTAMQETDVALSLFDFPAWTITIDGVVAARLEKSMDGLLVVRAPEGTHTIAAYWSRLPEEVVGAWISATALLFCLALPIWRRRHHAIAL